MTIKSDRAYNGIKGTNPGYLWFRVPKVGSSSLRIILHEHTEIEKDAYRLKLTPDAANGRFTFAFVRNPFDRLVSTWHDKVVQTETDEKRHYHSCFDKDFDFFVHFVCERWPNPRDAEAHVRAQTWFIPDGIDFLGRLENFTEDVRHVMQRLGVNNPDIPHLKAWPRPHYSTYYTTETRALMQEYYRVDLERFGYAFETEDA